MPKSNSATGAAVWSLIEKFATQTVSFIISIVLARLLTPSDYGIVGLMTIFLVVSNVFIDAGFGNAIIRKNDRTEKDLSTAFYFNLAISILIYVILWFVSPFIADFFDEQLLTSLIRIASLNLVLGSICIVHQALLTVELRIKEQTYIALISQIPSGCIAIFLAYKGFGVYALAIQALSASAIRTIAIWNITKWRPQKCISKKSFRYLLNFGSKLIGANLIGVAFDKVYTVLIGKYIGKSDLGFYSKAEALDNQIFSISNGAVQRIALPILSKSQDNRIILISNYREIMRLLVMVNAVISAFVVMESHDIVVFLWTNTWVQAADICGILAIANIWIPIASLSLILLQVVNRTDLILKLEFPKKMIYIVIIYIGFEYGVIGLVIGVVLINMVAAFINMYATKKVLHYSYISQILDIFKYIFIAFLISYICKVSIYRFDVVILNIIVRFLVVILCYFSTLLLIKDKVALKYFHKLLNKYIKMKGKFV